VDCVHLLFSEWYIVFKLEHLTKPQMAELYHICSYLKSFDHQRNLDRQRGSDWLERFDLDKNMALQALSCLIKLCRVIATDYVEEMNLLYDEVLINQKQPQMPRYADYIRYAYQILSAPLAECVVRELQNAYQDDWWTEVRNTIQEDLPVSGTTEHLAASLNPSHCARLIFAKWVEIFKSPLKGLNISIIREFGINYNYLRAYDPQWDPDHPEKDFEKNKAFRALGRISTVCKVIAPDNVEEIKLLCDKVYIKGIHTNM